MACGTEANTCRTLGYGLNAFLDFDTPADLLAHLVVGSEGTLAFVAEAVFDTVAVKPLTGPGHERRAYELTGAHACTYREAAARRRLQPVSDG